MTLEEKAKELRREYKREWCRRNPERVKNYNANYWLRKAEQRKKEESKNCGEEAK